MNLICNGIDNPVLKSLIGGRRFGLVTNPTGVDCRLQPTAGRLCQYGRLAALFAPEHGIRGDRQAGVELDGQELDSEYGVPSYSLYGATVKPTPEMLDGLELMIYDIQDVGARFYTYIYTLSYVMEACAECGLPLLVLDRVNPLGGTVIEGITLSERFSSMVGRYPLPVRYGLTVGEFAGYLNQTRHLGCDLSVAPCLNWRRDYFHTDCGLQWIMPSPNLPGLTNAICYIGTCLFEGTNISEGRGTTMPFSLIGAPFLRSRELYNRLSSLELPGIAWREAHFTPTFSKFCGELCHGLQMHITDCRQARPYRAGLELFQAIRETSPELTCTDFLDKLFGNDTLRLGTSPLADILSQAARDTAAFDLESQPFHLY